MRDMRVHYLQHVPFEGPAAVQDWAKSRGNAFSGTELFRIPAAPAIPAASETAGDLPDLKEIDFLVIMGGPMGVHDTAEHQWLETEKTFIRAAIDNGRAVLGICLGAQLIATVLGAPVTKNPRPEIGWYPVALTVAARADPLVAGFPNKFPALHWHGDTFAIPSGAIHLASSGACLNQAFSLEGGRVVGLQFHLETTPRSLALLAEHGVGNLAAASTEPWVASRDELLDPGAPYTACRKILFTLLDRMATTVGA
jgi:GMP synthase-like glutamine amidotransferase